MQTFISTAVIGLFIVVMGIINMTGNISSLHWYHRQRVSKDNINPYGKRIGLGTLIIGLSLIIFGVLYLIFDITGLMFFNVIGIVLLVLGLVIGLIMSIYAMIKYNKGIF